MVAALVEEAAAACFLRAGFAAAGLAARGAAAAARRFTGTTLYLPAAAFLGAGGLRALGFCTPCGSCWGAAFLLGPAIEVSLCAPCPRRVLIGLV